jgi:hypothetical protein
VTSSLLTGRAYHHAAPGTRREVFAYSLPGSFSVVLHKARAGLQPCRSTFKISKSARASATGLSLNGTVALMPNETSQQGHALMGFALRRSHDPLSLPKSICPLPQDAE